MKMTNMILLLATMIGFTANAAYDRRALDMKLPTQFTLERNLSIPVASSATRLLNAAAGAVGAGTKTYTASSIIAQPDVPRNIVITPGTSTGSVAAGTAVVTGFNARGQVITENFTVTSGSLSAITGNKAFSSVTSILLPAENAPYAATWSVGIGTKLGLKHCMTGSGDYVKGTSDGTGMSGETITASSSAVENNTIIPSPTPNGSHSFELFYIQNFLCP